MRLGVSCGRHGASCTVLGASWTLLRGFFGRLEASCGRLGLPETTERRSKKPCIFIVFSIENSDEVFNLNIVNPLTYPVKQTKNTTAILRIIEIFGKLTYL